MADPSRLPSILDPKRGLKGRALYLHLVENQKKWIAHCEENGKSYSGPRGDAIREADRNELRRLERLLSQYPEPRH